ncbi:MAG: GIY-YIG nuclease family protein [Lachnospiraceae bacterium]|nr:GIY-YIG nuclease family protein [Lachnospiraceae bacterium]
MATDKSDKWYIYILECADKTLYTGSTNDLDKRLEAHNSGNGAKYTKARLPVKLVYHEEFDDKKEAMKREWYIKHKLSRKQKMELITSK